MPFTRSTIIRDRTGGGFSPETDAQKSIIKLSGSNTDRSRRPVSTTAESNDCPVTSMSRTSVERLQNSRRTRKSRSSFAQIAKSITVPRISNASETEIFNMDGTTQQPSSAIHGGISVSSTIDPGPLQCSEEKSTSAFIPAPRPSTPVSKSTYQDIPGSVTTSVDTPYTIFSVGAASSTTSSPLSSPPSSPLIPPSPGFDDVFYTEKAPSWMVPMNTSSAEAVSTSLEPSQLDSEHTPYGDYLEEASVPRSATANPTTSNDLRPFECHAEDCGKTYKSQNALRNHQRLNNHRTQAVHDLGDEQSEVPVNDCVKAFNNQNTLSVQNIHSHQAQKEHQHDAKSFRCSVHDCKKAYTSKSGLEYHNKHGHNASENNDKPFKCLIIGCKKAYKSRGGVTYHNTHGHQTQHSNATGNSTYSMGDTEASIPNSDTLTIDLEHEKQHSLSHNTGKHVSAIAGASGIDSQVPRKKKAYHRKVVGITDITLLDGDERSVPKPGPDLLALVEEAKTRGELPKRCHSSVVRLIEGRWHAPQMCNTCQQTGTGGCDRDSPCIPCSNNSDSVCQSGGFMTILRAVRKSKTDENSVPLASSKRKGYQDVDTDASGSLAIEHDRQVKRRRIHGFDHDPTIVGVPKFVDPQDDTEITSADDAGRKRKASVSNLASKNQVKRSKKQNVSDKLEVSTETVVPEKGRRAEVKTTDHTVSKQRVRDMVSVVRKKKTAKELYHQSAQEGKPQPYGQPSVWADKRQQLCETLPYYRAYQSGIYMNDGKAYGLLCNKEVSPRDKFTDEIMITTAGGGRSQDETGKMVRIKDQDKCIIALAFERSMAEKVPVAVIAGQGNVISPTKLPHYYNVLDWFHVTDVWCEKQRGFKCWMVRLEKINLWERSWWSAETSQLAPPPAPPNFQEPKAAHQICDTCGKQSKMIYDQGWTCLKPECTKFFEFGSEVDDEALDYHSAFLQERREFKGTAPGSLAPALPTEENVERFDAFGTERECKKGIVCSKCGCCSRRIEWHQWKCENSICGLPYRIIQRPCPLEAAVAQSPDLKRGGKLGEFIAADIRFEQAILGKYDAFRYFLPGEEGLAGTILHLKPNGLIQRQLDGPNDLFRQMQEADFGLMRNPTRQKGAIDEVLTDHWAANWGAPYKYHVNTASRPFQEAKPVILKALKRLTWAGKQAMTSNTEKFHDFNELLSIGYFEDTHMGYHDDGEKELGPTVATLSLGASASMHWRPKGKRKVGHPSKNSRGTKRDHLVITLDHGDIVVMHGSLIQTTYEHQVIPRGKLRFALTCRYIRPELLDECERESAIQAGTLPPGSEKYEYDGDINAVGIPQPLLSQHPLDEMCTKIRAMVSIGELDRDEAKARVGELMALI